MLRDIVGLQRGHLKCKVQIMLEIARERAWRGMECCLLGALVGVGEGA